MITMKEIEAKFIIRVSYLTVGKVTGSDALVPICESQDLELPEDAKKAIEASFQEYKTIRVETSSVLSEIDEPRIQLIS